VSAHPGDISLDRARLLVQRAVDKAEQLGLRGAIAVVGSSGALVTASRLDYGGQGGMGRATSKAWIAATQQIPSTEHLHRMTTLAPPIAQGFVQVSPQARFPGAGGMPILEDGIVTGGIAASGATVSPFLPEGVAPEAISADGQPANPEDLLIACALDIPYAGQHGDDRARWAQRFGDLVLTPEASLGTRRAPPAQSQFELAWARALADRAIQIAAAQDMRVAVVVVDRGGDPVQQDRMDDAVPASVDVARAVAVTAARYGCASADVAGQFGTATDALRLLSPDPFLPVPGGVALEADGRVVGAIGVAGSSLAACAQIAATAGA
jgi:uncharacterized protein GlcG (DUF336 family)